ncbi:MAG: hypothetical protein CSA22_05305 [Deltaproteobacteria bacterium]|nr:MAG: hypothetical protein CSA22_05305 [Deltaproteobacteria bacterium]
MVQAQNAQEYINRLRGQLTSNPNCGTTHFNLGVALMGLQQYDEAEKAFFEAIDCSPSLAEAYVQLGGICLHRNDVEGCLSFNQRATKARAGFSIGFGNIGFLELQRGNVEPAIKALQKAISFNSKFVQAYTTLGSAYLMQGLVDEAIAAHKKALSIEPDFPIAYNNLAIALLEKGDTAGAVESFDKAVSLGYAPEPGLASEIDAVRTA